MNIYPSSKNAFTYFGNSEYSSKPYIKVSVSDTFCSGDELILTVKNTSGTDFSLTITGTDGGAVTSTSFNSTISYDNDPILSLAECMKKNISLFYDITLGVSDAGETEVTAYYDSSTNYKTTVNSGLTIKGNYDGKYIPLVKFTMHFNVNDGEEASEFDAEKYTNEEQIFFNLTSPFADTMTKYPITFKYTTYKSYNTANGTTMTQSLGSNSGTNVIMPTTCGEFYDLDYSDYIIDAASSARGQFLTNNKIREITYNERVALSVISSSINAQILTKFIMKCYYYTPNGVYITSNSETSLDKNAYYSETTCYRTDMYIDPCIEKIEAKYGKTVGYVEIGLTELSGVERTERIRLNVNGRCQNVNTVYFVNKIGGIDWYTFKGSTEIESDIDDQETYSSLYNGRIHNDKTYHQTNVRYKTMGKKKTLKSGRITHSEAKWLDELASSRYVFLTKEDKTNGIQFYEVVVDEVDIDINSSETYSECSISYYVGDKDIL